MKTKTKITAIVTIIIFTLSFSGCIFKKQVGVSYDLTLEVWGLFDDRDDYAEILENYQKINPAVKRIEYRKFSPDTYKKDILDALAAGQGPDIFLIHNTWLPSFKDKIVESPETVVNEQAIKNEFVDTVSRDFLDQSKIYALPLSVDSLALFYNKDILNRSGITQAANNWEEFKEDVNNMTEVDQFGNIKQAGAALGTAYNINRSTDILGALIFQNQGEINKEGSSQTTFATAKAENALKFYTQFSNSSAPSYSWNSRMHYSIDAFSEGNLAMMLNYSWQIETLKNKSPKLNFGVAFIPQLNNDEKVTYANYWGYAVAKNKEIKQESSDKRSATSQERIWEAWKFLRYLTMAPVQTSAGDQFDPAWNYLGKTKKPSARRDLIEKQKTDVNLGVFALQNLYAKAWTQYDASANEAILAEGIEQVVNGQNTPRQSLLTIESKVNKLIP